MPILIALEGVPGEYGTLRLATQLRADVEQRLGPAQRDAAAGQAHARELLPWLEAICARRPAPATLSEGRSTDETSVVPAGGLFVAEPGETLSPREVDVLRLIAAGASNQAIAEQLVICIHTVKTHVANILAKLGVASRTEAALRARHLGLE